jgi:MoaA/NifB/PqqE/SkfB family radical SAM enzyme
MTGSAKARPGKLRTFLDHQLRFPSKEWIQVEVTSRCNAACSYCPRTVFKDDWQDRTLPMELFKRLMPAFRHTGLVYLQGWGEPFLHPQFMTMARMAKDAGCRVGTTTNGMLLKERSLAEVVDSRMDVLAFSLAGTASATNDHHRPGTRLEQVLEAIRILEKIKTKRGTNLPAVHVAYMLLRSGIEELTDLPSLLGDTGVKQVVVSVLDFVPSDALSHEVLTTADLKENEIGLLFEEVRIQGEQRGISIHTPSAEPERIPGSCSENIQKALFVSSDGSVSPCTLTNVPVADGTACFAQGQPYLRTVFGSVRDSFLPAIWSSGEYARFRRAHDRGVPPEPCFHCPKLFR